MSACVTVCHPLCPSFSKDFLRHCPSLLPVTVTSRHRLSLTVCRHIEPSCCCLWSLLCEVLSWTVWQRCLWRHFRNFFFLHLYRASRYFQSLLFTNECTSESNVYWTEHHCNSWRMKDQLDVTCYFISLLMCSTCFGHYRIYSRNSRTFLTKILYLNLGCVIYARKWFYVNKSRYTGNFLNIVLKAWITRWRELRE